MYGQCLDSHILQSFSEFHDYLGILVPAEPGLYGNRFADSIDNTLGYHHHLVRLPHHSGTRSPAGDFADGTAEVNVNDITAVPSGYLVGVVRHLGSLDHRLRIVSVNLYRNRRFLLRRLHLRNGLGCITDKTV